MSTTVPVCAFHALFLYLKLLGFFFFLFIALPFPVNSNVIRFPIPDHLSTRQHLTNAYFICFQQCKVLENSTGACNVALKGRRYLSYHICIWCPLTS